MIYILAAILSLAMAGLETFSYEGFVGRHLGISAQYMYLASILLSLAGTANLSPTFKKTVLWLSLITTAGYIASIFTESITYPNFIFSRTHINLLTFQTFLFLSVFHAMVINRRKFLLPFLIALLVYVGGEGVGKTLGSMYRGIRTIVSDPTASYDSKMDKAYPGFYTAMQLIKELTPQSATIYIPPQANPWETEGNGAMVTYFLYPRKVLNGPLEGAPKVDKDTYIMIAKGSWKRTGDIDYGWPKVTIDANRIWRFDTQTKILTELTNNYDPKRDAWDWGLIEADYE